MYNLKWNDNSKRKPKKGDEYLVVWNLNDNKYPTTTVMDWDAIEKVWIDEKVGHSKHYDDILYWADLPKPPKGIKKIIWFSEL